MINIKINGKPIAVEAGTSIVEAAKMLKIEIPTLCYLKSLGPSSRCRVCLVECGGKLVTACSYPIFEGMEIVTNSPRVKKAIKTNLELILSTHNMDCAKCAAAGSCDLKRLAEKYDCNKSHYAGKKPNFKIDNSSPAFIRNDAKCILCGRCIEACKQKQSVSVVCASGRGFGTKIGYAFGDKVKTTDCVNCGQCVIHCPTGALVDNSRIVQVEALLKDRSKRVVVATAPSVRIALGEEFGYPIGTDVEGKMVSALKAIGFDDVFDINFSADLTIVEEAHEFLERFEKKEKLPMFTSCCPGWMNFLKNFYPNLLQNTSTCKSPQQMFGAVAKTYYAQKLGIAPEKLAVVTIMPCVAKKDERLRKGMNASDGTDVDVTLTTRELARLIDLHEIDFTRLRPRDFDPILGISSGAGVIFGNTGGVMEAALRTVADTISGQDLKVVEYNLVRGLSGIKEATLELAGQKVSIAVVSGLANARRLIEDIISGKKNYDFVEVMACPGGCVNGGGQPIPSSTEINFVPISQKRAHGLYANDENKRYRKSHQNPAIIEYYRSIGKPGGKLAHQVLHVNQIKLIR